MSIYEGLGLDIHKFEVLSFIGGGGKTTAIFSLAEELKKLGKKVLITTTTAIFNPETGYDYYFLGDINNFKPKKGSITVFGERVARGKLLDTPPEKISNIVKEKIFDYILIEADGSKRKPIKGHADYEPVIIKETTTTIGIIGLDALDQRIDEIVHRPEIFIKLTNTKYSDIISEETIVTYVLNPEGIFNKSKGRKILILNKANNKNLVLRANNIRKLLLDSGFKESVLITDIKDKMFY